MIASTLFRRNVREVRGSAVIEFNVTPDSENNVGADSVTITRLRKVLKLSSFNSCQIHRGVAFFDVGRKEADQTGAKGIEGRVRGTESRAHLERCNRLVVLTCERVSIPIGRGCSHSLRRWHLNFKTFPGYFIKRRHQSRAHERTMTQERRRRERTTCFQRGGRKRVWGVDTKQMEEFNDRKDQRSGRNERK